jgi:hypothetical protein
MRRPERDARVTKERVEAERREREDLSTIRYVVRHPAVHVGFLPRGGPIP